MRKKHESCTNKIENRLSTICRLYLLHHGLYWIRILCLIESRHLKSHAKFHLMTKIIINKLSIIPMSMRLSQRIHLIQLITKTRWWACPPTWTRICQPTASTLKAKWAATRALTWKPSQTISKITRTTRARLVSHPTKTTTSLRCRSTRNRRSARPNSGRGRSNSSRSWIPLRTTSSLSLSRNRNLYIFKQEAREVADLEVYQRTEKSGR